MRERTNGVILLRGKRDLDSENGGRQSRELSFIGTVQDLDTLVFPCDTLWTCLSDHSPRTKHHSRDPESHLSHRVRDTSRPFNFFNDWSLKRVIL